MVRIGTDYPHEISPSLADSGSDLEFDIFLHKIFRVLSMEMLDLPKAREVVMRNMFELPQQCFRPLFEKMIKE